MTTADKLAELVEAGYTGKWAPSIADYETDGVIWLVNDGGDSLMVTSEDAALMASALPEIVELVRACGEIQRLDAHAGPITEGRAGDYRRAWTAVVGALAALEAKL